MKPRSYAISRVHADGAFDTLSVERAGLVRLEGWTTVDRIDEVAIPVCHADGTKLEVFEVFRAYRPDVATAKKTDQAFLGLVVLYQVPEETHREFTHLTLTLGDTLIFEINDAFFTQRPPYSRLLATPHVLHRENIYGYGPPATIVAEEVGRLGRMAPGPLLDFGCGAGVLIKALRAHGIEAYGLEVDRKPITEGIFPEVEEFIKLYDGNFPIPFADGEFESVIATEVIEHVPDYERALDEIARVTRSTFMITVPDISSIPICHHNNVVPWHLLESTHVNFFTQTSLRSVLSKHYADIQCARICPTVTNGSKWFGSLAAICRK